MSFTRSAQGQAPDKSMIEISVAELFGTICTDPEDGSRLCELVFSELSAGSSVKLNFERVELVASAFLNSAIGCLYKSFSPDHLSIHLTWHGLDQTDLAVVSLVVRNAIRFFSADADERARLSATSSHLIES
jgi:hypothetical protein